MDSTYISIIIFLIITGAYYFGLKPSLTVSILNDKDEYSGYALKLYATLLVYFLATILSQFGINISVLIANCGGSVVKNVALAAYITFIPWFFIFGALMGILMIFPGFKSAFSNVVGYFAVSTKANQILTELLENNEINAEIDSDPEASKNKASYQSAADAIIKLIGNMSILINQIVPDNFEEYWTMLTPLMKEKYKIENASSELKQQLLDIVVRRDNIGEALWYIYAAILIISITQFQLVSNGCQQDIATMEANHAKFLKDEDKLIQQDAKLKSTTYTIS